MKTIKELYDRTDAAKWSHPEIEVVYEKVVNTATTLDVTYNFDLPEEVRAASVDKISEFIDEVFLADKSNPSIARRELLTAPGCPEEPDTPVELVVYRPQGVEGDKLPVIFGVAGGSMFLATIEAGGFVNWADPHGAVVICPRYRGVYQGKYPAAINDLHAGYQYVVEHAEELGIDPDRIVIFSQSSGTNLSISLAYRLKRYGYRPRGVVACGAFTDNRPIYATSTIDSGNNWDARAQWRASLQYLGFNYDIATATPEMYPNYATPEETIGLCPIFLHSDAEEGNSGSCRAFSDICSKAGVYHELHDWGGACHSALGQAGMFLPDCSYAELYMQVIGRNIDDCLNYDLRRSWIVDEPSA